MMAAGEEGLWGGGDFLLPIKSEKNHFFLFISKYINTVHNGKYKYCNLHISQKNNGLSTELVS